MPTIFNNPFQIIQNQVRGCINALGIGKFGGQKRLPTLRVIQHILYSHVE